MSEYFPAVIAGRGVKNVIMLMPRRVAWQIPGEAQETLGPPPHLPLSQYQRKAVANSYTNANHIYAHNVRTMPFFWQKLFGNLQIIHSNKSWADIWFSRGGGLKFSGTGGPHPSQNVQTCPASKKIHIFTIRLLGDPGNDTVVHGHRGSR